MKSYMVIILVVIIAITVVLFLYLHSLVKKSPSIIDGEYDKEMKEKIQQEQNKK